jgi:dihydrofolate reductase
VQPLALIVARARGGVIGRGGTLPWHEPEDLERFKRLTLGHAVIMGRRTHASIGRPLPCRRNLVVSRQEGLAIDGCEVFGSFPAALAAAYATDACPFVIGGAALYAEALPRATRIHLTEVARDVTGDVGFPDLDESAWIEREREVAAGGRLVFRLLERREDASRSPRTE